MHVALNFWESVGESKIHKYMNTLLNQAGNLTIVSTIDFSQTQDVLELFKVKF